MDVKAVLRIACSNQKCSYPIEDIFPVCGSQHNDTFLGSNTIHLHKKLVESLFSLASAPSRASSTTTLSSCNSNTASEIWTSLNFGQRASIWF